LDIDRGASPDPYKAYNDLMEYRVQVPLTFLLSDGEGLDALRWELDRQNETIFEPSPFEKTRPLSSGAPFFTAMQGFSFRLHSNFADKGRYLEALQMSVLDSAARGAAVASSWFNAPKRTTYASEVDYKLKAVTIRLQSNHVEVKPLPPSKGTICEDDDTERFFCRNHGMEKKLSDNMNIPIPPSAKKVAAEIMPTRTETKSSSLWI
jgi:hypothetical protein